MADDIRDIVSTPIAGEDTVAQYYEEPLTPINFTKRVENLLSRQGIARIHLYDDTETEIDMDHLFEQFSLCPFEWVTACGVFSFLFHARFWPYVGIRARHLYRNTDDVQGLYGYLRGG